MKFPFAIGSIESALPINRHRAHLGVYSIMAMHRPVTAGYASSNLVTHPTWPYSRLVSTLPCHGRERSSILRRVAIVRPGNREPPRFQSKLSPPSESGKRGGFFHFEPLRIPSLRTCDARGHYEFRVSPHVKKRHYEFPIWVHVILAVHTYTSPTSKRYIIGTHRPFYRSIVASGGG